MRISLTGVVRQVVVDVGCWLFCCCLCLCVVLVVVVGVVLVYCFHLGCLVRVWVWRLVLLVWVFVGVICFCRVCLDVIQEREIRALGMCDQSQIRHQLGPIGDHVHHGGQLKRL